MQCVCVSFPAFTVISPVTKINASELPQRFDVILSVSHFTELFWLYLSFAVWLSFFVANLDSYCLNHSINLYFFCVSILYDTYRIL